MSLRVSYQLRYSLRSSYIAGAVGCQMPMSGNVLGSAISMSMSLRAGTYALEILEEEVLEVVGAAAEPVLQGVHEVAGVLGLVGGEVLEHLGEGAHELEHALLEAARLLLLHEGRDGGLGLAELRHGEGAELVGDASPRAWRGRSGTRRASRGRGRDHLDDLLGELLDEDQGADEDVRLLNVLLPSPQGSSRREAPRGGSRKPRSTPCRWWR